MSILEIIRFDIRFDVIRFDTDDTLPLDTMINVDSMTIVIRSVYRTCFDRFYPQTHLVSCTYVQKH